MAPVFSKKYKGRGKDDPDVMHLLDESISELKKRMLYHVGQPDLTHEDVLSLFAPAEDREILRRAREVSAVQGSRKYFETPWALNVPSRLPPSPFNATIALTVWVNDTPAGKHPLLPISPELQPDCDPIVVRKITNWVETHARIVTDWRRVSQVLADLNWLMDTPEQMQFMWPVLRSLCTMQRKLGAISTRIREVKPPRNIPQLSQDLRVRLRKTLGTVSGALLLDEVTDDYGTEKYPVVLSIDAIPDSLQRIYDTAE